MPHGPPDREATRRRFDEVAADYDGRFVRFIDRYEEMHDLMIGLIRQLQPGARRFLDLGTGTGEVSRRLLEAFPAAQVRGVDFSARMVQRARSKLAGHGARFVCEIADLAGFSPEASGPYDAIVSALAIHHIPDGEKRRLAHRACRAIRPGGLFLNADLVTGDTDREGDALLALQVEGMRARGVAEEDIQQRVQRHRQHDIPATLADQIRWLREAGCREVWVPWRHLQQVLIVGLMPS